MSLSEQRVKFSQLLVALELYAQNKQYKLARDEGRVLFEREGRADIDGISQKFKDSVHMANSFHYSGLAQDYVLYDANMQPETGLTPAWNDLAEYWKRLDPLCSWGGDFVKTATGAHSDFVHFSYGEGK